MRDSSRTPQPVLAQHRSIRRLPMSLKALITPRHFSMSNGRAMSIHALPIRQRRCSKNGLRPLRAVSEPSRRQAARLPATSPSPHCSAQVSTLSPRAHFTAAPITFSSTRCPALASRQRLLTRVIRTLSLQRSRRRHGCFSARPWAIRVLRC